MMIEKGQIEISPITYVRGRSFENAYIIVDEAQNLTIHELKTLITRCGQNTKMILLGDIDQVDTPYMDRYSNGLTIAIEKLKGQELFGHIRLDRGERSELATLASNIL
jgi:PhoH-like ATPase